VKEFWRLVSEKNLRRLLALRWSGQLTDGIFQSGLASFVLFSPERQASAMAAALGFTVVLLPYSIVGPLVGTVLDKFPRQRIAFFANTFRVLILIFISYLVFTGIGGVLLVISVLFAFAANRLLLAGLSAGLPLMIDRTRLIGANAIAVTGGSIFLVLGGGVGLTIRQALNQIGNADKSDGVLLMVAAFGYFLAMLLSTRIKKFELGPLPHEDKTTHALREGIAFLRQHNDAARGIFATSIQRGGLTALIIVALLLERNTFHDPTDSEAGLAGVGLALSIAAVGVALGAVIAPYGAGKFGRHRWIRYMAYGSAITPFYLGLAQNVTALYVTAFVASMCGQSMKVTNDALVQSKITDDFRGRTFAIYDTTTNTAIVVSALSAAIATPNSGQTLLVPTAISLIYLALGLFVLRPPRS
jgi:MFS family permease